MVDGGNIAAHLVVDLALIEAGAEMDTQISR